MGASSATRRSRRRATRLAEGLALAAAVWLPAPVAAGEAWTVGADARIYQFLRVDDTEERRDAELALLRLKLGASLPAGLGLEAHGVAGLTSPPATAATTVATGTTRRFLDLQETVRDGDLEVALEVDRLSLTWEGHGLRVVAGRQAITWGVSQFWPALDLFAPFAPERIDREYKPGVDAVRATIALGPLSELDLVAAALGPDAGADGSLAGLLRLHLGAADVGVMAGGFHGDVVLGAFVAADAGGTGVRAEIAATHSGDRRDERLGRERFVRVTVGLDRQLTETLLVSGEAGWNGFGSGDPDDYPRIAAADRVRRGEVVSLGRWMVGASVAWRAHPLVEVTVAGLVNLDDGSALLLPQTECSLTERLTLLLGGTAGVGHGRARDGTPRSEYGAAPIGLYAALKAYF